MVNTEVVLADLDTMDAEELKTPACLELLPECITAMLTKAIIATTTIMPPIKPLVMLIK